MKAAAPSCLLLLLQSAQLVMSSSSNNNNKWAAAGLSQTEFMQHDTVLVVDNNDCLTGETATKHNAHIFSKQQPHGVLHRAFSVFLFDASTKKLLLQQRASHKITFPNVWTNTCCSHPLHGMEPCEVDLPDAIAAGTVVGVKQAALRKLQQELGCTFLQVSDFHFLTRLHYWAADTVTHGAAAPWGEHEIDYVLFAACNKTELALHPNPDEVSNTKWVSPQELQSMMRDPSLLFSPWFRLICQTWLLTTWWKDLDGAMAGTYDDFVSIHTFDPPPEHFGGAGHAQPLFANSENNVVDVGGDASKKQGAYGKIKTHKESKVKQLLYLDEIFAALTILYVKPLESNLGSDYIQQRFPKDDLDFCNTILVKVSRSFAAVIRQLPSVLLVDILLFYLILRALDTIEDDTHAFASHDEKVQHLMNFAQNALGDPTWRMDGVGQGDEKLLLQEFPKAHRVYAALSDESRTVITDITQRMAHGMAEFVGKDLGQGTRDIEEYNRYCHFVAGLVGEGLSRLFAASGLENPTLAGELRLSDQMGLFLQKTNIIRDYLEDYVDKRAFWPQSVWNKYSETADLGYFVNQNDTLAARKSLECLNELVADALELVPDCLAYLDRLKCLEVFRFCAIPQVMAIATLAKCFANSDVFTGVVKIRKGLSCKLLLRTNNIAEVHDTFHEFAQSIMSKAKSERRNGVMDPNYSRILRACESICGLTNVEAARQRQTRTMRLLVCGSILGVGAFKQPKAVQVCLALAAGLVYVYGPWTVQSKLKPAAFLLDKKNV